MEWRHEAGADWTELRRQGDVLARQLAEAHAPHGDVRAVESCSRTGFVIELECGAMKPSGFWRCRHVLCPTCARIKAQAWRRRLFGALDTIREKPHRLLFVTLTVPNVDGAAELRRTLRVMRRALVRLRRVRRAGQSWLPWRGGFVATEVTASADAGLHPHLHLLVEVPPAYFDTGRTLYVPQHELQAAWEAALRAEGLDVERAIAHVAAVRPGDERGAGVEVAKYLTAPAALGAVPAALVGALLGGVKGSRLFSTFGSWRALVRDGDEAVEELAQAEAELATEGAEELAAVPAGVLRVWSARWDGRRYRLRLHDATAVTSAAATMAGVTGRPRPPAGASWPGGTLAGAV